MYPPETQYILFIEDYNANCCPRSFSEYQVYIVDAISEMLPIKLFPDSFLHKFICEEFIQGRVDL